MASRGVRTRGRDGRDGPAVPCCALCSPLTDAGDVAVVVCHCRHRFGQGALSLSSLLLSTFLVMWQLPSVGSWSANGRWGDGRVLTWVVGAFPVLSSPSLSSHHPALAVFALPVVLDLYVECWIIPWNPYGISPWNACWIVLNKHGIHHHSMAIP